MITYTSTLASNATEPLTMEDVCNYLKIDYIEDNSLIDDLITAARESAEEFCNRSFVAHNIILSTTDFDVPVHLPFPDVDVISSVKVDGEYVEYTVTGSGMKALSVIADGGSELVVEYSTLGICPARVKEAIRLIIKDFYDNRGDQKVSENGYVYLLPYKVI